MTRQLYARYLRIVPREVSKILELEVPSSAVRRPALSRRAVNTVQLTKHRGLQSDGMGYPFPAIHKRSLRAGTDSDGLVDVFRRAASVPHFDAEPTSLQR